MTSLQFDLIELTRLHRETEQLVGRNQQQSNLTSSFLHAEVQK